MSSGKKPLSDVEKAIIRVISEINKKKSGEATSRNINKMREKEEGVVLNIKKLRRRLKSMSDKGLIEAFRFAEADKREFCYRVVKKD